MPGFDARAVMRDFGRAAARYDAHAQLQREVRAQCIALATWADGAQLLDLGCGTGALSREAPQWRVTGVDLSAGMCARAAAHQAVAVADAALLPFADGAFDGVFSSLMLQWANDPRAVWREVARVLRPGGTCVLATLSDGTLNELSRAFSHLDAAPHVSTLSNAVRILKDVTQSGLTLLSLEARTRTDFHPDALSLMRSLKAIGAVNKHSDRPRGLMTPSMLDALEGHYRREFATGKGLPATWKILYVVVGKW